LALIKSISGIRGTIGGNVGDNFTAQDIVECTAAFGAWLLEKGNTPKVVIGRDARRSGQLVQQLVVSTLMAQGIDVVNLGLSTTPTVELAVVWEQAGAGIIITASHNPGHWNALKFLNEKGEFISQADGESLLAKIGTDAITYAALDDLGSLTQNDSYLQQHIQAVLDYPLVDVAAIKASKLTVVVDGINSSGSVAVPALLQQLGCKVHLINGEPNGYFAHNPEPLAAHLTDLSATIVQQQAALGISVDPDVDRLAFVCEDGSMFGEEYTLVAVADYVLRHRQGPTVSNLSSTRALRDVTQHHGQTYYASAVGEVNVVAQMKAQNAVIGGEGNGGIIVPDFHYGRDALIGIGLFLTHLCQTGQSMTNLRASYPQYEMIKDKINLAPDLNLEERLQHLEHIFQSEDCNTMDGLKINFDQGWVHLRKSNTEPIIRVYAEATDAATAQDLVNQVKRHF